MVFLPFMSSIRATFPPLAVPISSMLVMFQGLGENQSNSKI
nr:MAG TPA: hypothetical protein [Caudoviricetes sp.]